MPTYEIELFWQCSTCTHIIGGLQKECENCGKPRTEHELDIWPKDLSAAKAIKDPARIKQARAGADWKCKYCGSSQRRDDGKCKQCGADQRQGREVHQDTKVVGVDLGTGAALDDHVIKDAPAPESTVTEEQMVQEDMMKEVGEMIRSDFAPEARTLPRQAPLRRKEKKVVKRFTLKPAGIVAIGLVAFACLLYFLLKPRVVDVQVSSLEWVRTVHVDRYRVFHRDGWSPDYGAFRIQDEGQRVHHYDHVRVGSHEERYTEQVACGQNCITPSCYTTPVNCSSNKNGTASCSGGDQVCPSPICTTRYCGEPRTRTVDEYEDQPRYQMWYSWKVWDWGHDRDASTSGTSTEVSWATPEQTHLGIGIESGEKEREASREEWFHVLFAGDGDTWKFDPKSEDEFKRYPVGKKYKIKVRRIGPIEVLHAQ